MLLKSRSPILEGFRVMFRQPALGMAEISWRWSLGAVACLLLSFTFLQYLSTLPVTSADLLLLRTRQPVLISQAIAHIFRGSGFRFVVAMMVAVAALAAGWIVTASVARAATLKWLVEYFRGIRDESSGIGVERQELRAWRRGGIRSLTGLNFLRVASTIAAAVGCIGATILAGFVSSPKDPQPGLVFLLFVPLVCLVWLLWSVLNWFLSLASVFVMRDGRDAFGGLAAAVGLCRERMGTVSAVGFWFGLAHVVAFVVATSVVAFPLALAAVLPGGVVLGGVLLVSLLYFAVVDFLYGGRLAAYVAIAEFPPAPPTAVAAKVILPVNVEPETGLLLAGETRPSCVSTESLISEDDILSDIPFNPPDSTGSS